MKNVVMWWLATVASQQKCSVKLGPVWGFHRFSPGTPASVTSKDCD